MTAVDKAAWVRITPSGNVIVKPNAGRQLLPEAAAERSNCLVCQGGLVYFFSFAPPGVARVSDISAEH
jgi:hypothetical protein